MNWVSISSDNGLAPIRRQAIILTNAGLLSIGPWRTNFSEILIKIQNFSFTKIHLKISSAKWRPFCPRGNELIDPFIYRWWKTDSCQSAKHVTWMTSGNMHIMFMYNMYIMYLSRHSVCSSTSQELCTWFTLYVLLWFGIGSFYLYAPWSYDCPMMTSSNGNISASEQKIKPTIETPVI